jgi:hypothetical protein
MKPINFLDPHGDDIDFMLNSVNIFNVVKEMTLQKE